MRRMLCSRSVICANFRMKSFYMIIMSKLEMYNYNAVLPIPQQLINNIFLDYKR